VRKEVSDYANVYACERIFNCFASTCVHVVTHCDFSFSFHFLHLPPSSYHDRALYNALLDGNHKENLKNEVSRKHEKVKGEKSKSNSKSQKTHTNGNHTVRDKSKNLHLQSNSDNADDETDESDDTPSISSITDSGTVSECDSGKSSPPSSFPDHPHHAIQTSGGNSNLVSSTSPDHLKSLQNEQQTKSIISSPSSIIDTNDITSTSLYSNNNNNDKVNSSILKDSANLADTSSEYRIWFFPLLSSHLLLPSVISR
jgi:hypothetical protein